MSRITRSTVQVFPGGIQNCPYPQSSGRSVTVVLDVSAGMVHMATSCRVGGITGYAVWLFPGCYTGLCLPTGTVETCLVRGVENFTAPGPCAFVLIVSVKVASGCSGVQGLWSSP